MGLKRTFLPLAMLALAPVTSNAQTLRPAAGARESMWPAPSAEDWAKPCLIQWERTWEDAQAASRETKRPILICVNMDGEIASEHYAGIRYRQPEITELYAPYITVIASVFRHSARDYDEQGRRVVCPRFGGVTCGEHIRIEPLLFKQYFEGRRVAPRHIIIELDGVETEDVFYTRDTASVFRTIEKGISERKEPLLPRLENAGPVEDLVLSHYNSDKTAVEEAYATGDKETRSKIMKRVVQAGSKAPLDLLRLAVFGLDLEMARLARQGLAAATDLASLDLIAEALKVPMDAREREALIAALERFGSQSTRARSLGFVHRGLVTKSNTIDASHWNKALKSTRRSSYVIRERKDLETKVRASATRKGAAEKSAAEWLTAAEAFFELAIDPSTTRLLAADPKSMQRYGRLRFTDTERAARRAESLGASGWRVDALIALSCYYQGKLDEAYLRSEKAAKALPLGTESWRAMAVLALFADARRASIEKALASNSDWPPIWLADLNSAYSVLAKHPHGSDDQVASQYDFLVSLSASTPAGQVLQLGLARHPASSLLHARLRRHLLAEEGLSGLESTYERMLLAPDANPSLPWFAGLSTIVAAEYHRRASEDELAFESYERAIELYSSCLEGNQDWSASSKHYIAIALAGEARLKLQQGELQAALEFMLACFQTSPLAAASLDGLGFSPASTASMLRARLKLAGNASGVQQLQAALDHLDSIDRALLDLPASERGLAPPRR